ncbi:restriction endonuclease subunit S [Listeria aquatica]|uniref:restriction endonuclease subunit S n=1 Tax=Listeria aquatica TaxID=1494960 RepID=UPI003F6EC740
MNRKVPEIRFEGFTEEWEERRVGDFLTESRIKGSNGSKAKKLTVKLWRKGIVPKEEIYQGSTATQYYIRKAGQFMYGKLDFLNQAFGIVPDELNGYESTLDSPAFDIDKKMNSQFLLEYIVRERFYKYQGNIANGSRKAKRIHTDTFFNMPIFVPCTVEQDLIGEILKKMENIIILQEHKLENLKKSKKGFLQKMFPKNGEQVPEIRFDGFLEKWEERKLRNVGTISTGNTPSTSEKKYYSENGIMWITPTDITSLITTKSAKQLSDLGESKAKIVPAGAILVTCIASIGKNTMVLNKSGFNQQINALVPSEYNDSYFLLTQSEFWSRKMKSIAASGTMQIVNKSDFSNLTFDYPAAEEQQKIGNFFKKLDDTIALQERQLENLKKTKQAFLQKMFI